MQPYQRHRLQQEKKAGATGIVATLLLHALALVVLFTAGLPYLDPPPPERSLLLVEFEEEAPQVKPLPVKKGRQPQAEKADPEKPVELVQKAASPHVNDRPNVAPQAQPDAHGDVETPAPEAQPEIERKTLFPGMSRKENSATAPHAGSEASDSFKAGQPDGNVRQGVTEGTPNAKVQGRYVVDRASLEKPAYNSQQEGIVVVQIKVDQYGNVTEAVPGAEGTTLIDKKLWAEARSKALKAHFNPDANAPALQAGTITYIFKLK